MQTSLDHDLVASNSISEYGLIFYSLKSPIQVIMSKEQLKKELNKLKALQSGLKKKIDLVERNLNLFRNDKPTTEKEISQIVASKIKKHSSEDSPSPKSPRKSEVKTVTVYGS
jgi:hypothetical protein